MQLRSGAAAASGDVLLVLHADARLPPAGRDAILKAMDDPDVINGRFYVRFLPVVVHALAGADLCLSVL